MIAWRRRQLAPVLGSSPQLMSPSCIGSLATTVLLILLGLASNVSALAQVRPEVRDQVIPAVVQIFIVGEVAVNGLIEPLVLPMGSGTVVTAKGQVLTNWHVVDMVEHRKMLDSWEAQAASEGESISIQLIEESVLIFTSDGENPPEPRYIAVLAVADKTLDLAVLQIVGDGTGLMDPASLNLPFVPLGDSNAVGLGDPIDIFGYPGISGGVLTYTEGVVSGFMSAEGGGRAWIVTDATMSGGSSGGTALNREGELIGVPTQGSSIDCRPGDVNRDGRLDASDVGCIPTGGSLGQLRPANFAIRLITQAESATSQTPGEENLVPVEGNIPISALDRASMAPIANLLPTLLPLDHATCFRTEVDAEFTFDDLAARLGGTEDVRLRLHDWGWRASANRIFACDAPPDGEAGWIDISVHLFGTSAAAQQAVDYFAAVRAEGTWLVSASPPAIGDHSAVLSGPTSNGKEFTLYASQGPLLIRVTGVSPSGIPFMNVLAVAQSVLDAQQLAPQPRTDPSASGFLPDSLPVGHSSCFSLEVDEVLSLEELSSRFPDPSEVASLLPGWGWQSSANRGFACDEPPVGSAGWVDASVHQFADASAAQQAMNYFVEARAAYGYLSSTLAPIVGDRSAALTGQTTNGTEYTLYATSGPFLVRVTGVSPSGTPTADVEAVTQKVLAEIGGNTSN